MTTNNKLTEIVEGVRAQKYPDLPSELVSEILDVQLRLQDDPAEARKRTQQALHKHVTNALSEGPQEDETP